MLGETETVPAVAKVRVSDGALFLLGRALQRGDVVFNPPLVAYSLTNILKWREVAA